MSSKKWHPSAQESDFWAQVTKEVKKQQFSKLINLEPNLAKPMVLPKEQRLHHQQSCNLKELILNDNSNVDSRTIAKLKKGDYQIDGSIDLHGYTLLEAVRKFEEFILQAWQLKKRLLLIITGKGIGESSIRSMIKSWVHNKNVRPFVLRIGFAPAKHGGTGAFYVLLKRDRQQKKLYDINY